MNYTRQCIWNVRKNKTIPANKFLRAVGDRETSRKWFSSLLIKYSIYFFFFSLLYWSFTTICMFTYILPWKTHGNKIQICSLVSGIFGKNFGWKNSGVDLISFTGLYGLCHSFYITKNNLKLALDIREIIGKKLPIIGLWEVINNVML